MPNASFSNVAGGDIFPSRFVKLDPSGPGKVLQAGAGDRPFGISQVGTRNTPYSTLDDGKAAVAGENLRVYGPPETDVPLELGGPADEGQLLMPDANGCGILATGVLGYGAICLRAGIAGDLVPVQVNLGQGGGT